MSCRVLDDIDRRILSVVQAEGRISALDLADLCEVSYSACLTRFRRLQNEGYIQGFVTLLDPEKLDRQTLLFIKISLHRNLDNAFGAFAGAIASLPEILECHLVAGRYDYLLKARIKDLADYRRFLDRTLTAIPAVRQLQTHLVLEEVKYELLKLPPGAELAPAAIDFTRRAGPLSLQNSRRRTSVWPAAETGVDRLSRADLPYT